MYETAYRGIRDHDIMRESFKEFGGKEVAPPSQCALSKNNIDTCEKVKS